MGWGGTVLAKETEKELSCEVLDPFSILLVLSKNLMARTSAAIL